MRAKNISNEFFPELLIEVEPILLGMSFTKCSYIKKGYAYYVEYKKGDSIVKFMYGPSEYHVEMVIYIPNRKFELKDLLEIPEVASWANNYRHVQFDENIIKNELLWYIELMKFSLPIICPKFWKAIIYLTRLFAPISVA